MLFLIFVIFRNKILVQASQNRIFIHGEAPHPDKRPSTYPPMGMGKGIGKSNGFGFFTRGNTEDLL